MARTKVKQSGLNPYPALGFAPLPTSTATSVGEFKVITASVGVAAGGTQIFAASSGNQPHAMCWRVS